ncbi:uncharacterized protein UHOD_12072 [Ustilago sp. UG-2017b]|nr:uncharacterized protein UHOD_12072 [Ustilago sp. UG-2017b]
MVRASDKQELLEDIETVIIATLLVETELKLELASTADAWHPNDDLDDSDDDDFDHAVSQALITTHSIINKERYSLPHIYIPQHNQTLLDMLDHYLTTSRKRFQGLVCMTPEAFEALVLRLSTTVAFQHITNSRKVRQQVAVGLYHLGCSGNGGGVHDIALACDCSWGSADAWSRRTVDGLYELNQEAVTFAMEDERANASAWVIEKSGVEEWGVRGRAPGTQVGLSGYSVTIKLRDDSGGLLPSVLSISGPLTCYGSPSDISVASDAAPALSPESTFFVEYCTGGPSSTAPVLLELCVDPFDTAPPPQDLFAGLAGLLYTAPPPSAVDGSSGSYLPSP